MKWRAIPILFLCVALSASSAETAPERPTAPIPFGPEFTFSNLRMLYSENFEKEKGKTAGLLERYAKWLEKICESKDCIVQRTHRKDDGGLVAVAVLLEDGTLFKASTDMNVIEFSINPLTVEEWEKRATEIQHLVFDGMAELSLVPQSLYGSGHVNIDLPAAFGGDVRALRDFFVDFFNHPAIADGVLEKDPFNARSFSLFGEAERSAFFSIVADVDTGKIGTIEAFRSRMGREVLKGGALGKGYALLLKPNRLEIRSARAQKDVGEFIELARLFSARIAYLRKQRKLGNPVVPLERVGVNFGWQSFSQFYYYVNDAGADWKKVREKLLLPEYRIYPSVLSREHAFGDRIACVYWLKNVRAKIYDSIALGLSGLGK